VVASVYFVCYDDEKKSDVDGLAARMNGSEKSQSRDDACLV
jgi:hypothetical protein